VLTRYTLTVFAFLFFSAFIYILLWIIVRELGEILPRSCVKAVSSAFWLAEMTPSAKKRNENSVLQVTKQSIVTSISSHLTASINSRLDWRPIIDAFMCW
jgi:predicted PurR-regulated permease PerM